MGEEFVVQPIGKGSGKSSNESASDEWRYQDLGIAR
ncbi:hypothetical protein FVER14953_20750 [Fusarium verticillioides]|nr:hypothetical protein FVER14953_20750 [Fusarium verticillioides]